MQVGMGRGVLCSTAAKQQPVTASNRLKTCVYSRFSTVWKKVFHSVEKSRKKFP